MQARNTTYECDSNDSTWSHRRGSSPPLPCLERPDQPRDTSVKRCLLPYSIWLHRHAGPSRFGPRPASLPRERRLTSMPGGPALKPRAGPRTRGTPPSSPPPSPAPASTAAPAPAAAPPPAAQNAVPPLRRWTRLPGDANVPAKPISGKLWGGPGSYIRTKWSALLFLRFPL